jgi:CDP-glycerol glycerophosphotransferase (TagB/SpsB family)
VKIDRRNPYHWLILIRQYLYTLVAICMRYLCRKPRKPIVVLYGHQLSGNLKALYEEWQRTYQQEFDCHFLTLDPQYSRLLLNSGVNVLHCGRITDMLLVGRCSAIITDHGLHTMTPFIALTNIVFIDVWHGIPFKGFVPEDFQLQHRYNEVWVSSPLLKDIYQNKFGFKPEIVKSLGYARADKLFLKAPPDPLLIEKAAITAGHKVVLYAPTWQQDDTGRELFPFGESQESFIQRISETCQKNKAVLVIRSHLNASINTKHFENVRYCSMKDFPDTEDLLLLTDVLICDWSSIAFDYLALNRPTVFLEVEPPFRHGFSLGKEYRFGKVATDMDILCATIGSALENSEWYASDQNQTHREITSAVYGENTNGESSARQWSRLIDLVDSKRI